MDFVHLHVHTEYSLLDGANRIKDLVKKVKDLGMSSIAITDHGSMYGVIEFYKECKKNNIKPIIGCEVYMAPRSRFDKLANVDSEYAHLILLAKNNEGYENLIKLVSLSFIEGYYYKPRIDKEILRQYSKGLICTSACLGGEIPASIINGDYEKAKSIALEYIDIFGKEDFYIELQNNGIQEQVLANQGLIKLANELGLKLVATNDAHYLNKEDAYPHEVLLCVQTAKKITDEDRMQFGTDQFYIKTQDEMYENFKNIPQALENTLEIAEKCNVEFTFGVTILPNYTCPDNQDNNEYFRNLCYEGMNKKYSVVTQEIKDRLEYEISVIEKMGYVDYFLIVWDFIKYSKDNGIMVGPGRGSGAGSLAAYCVDITDVDPLKFNLIFERFLNPDRISMPDFDIDFCYERRGEVIDYVCRKYGSDHVAQIITFGTMAARGVIRDVGRVLNMEYQKIDSIAKMIPMEIHITIEKALEMNPELKSLYENDDQIKSLIDISKKLEGLPRHASTHAAGVVITKNPVDSYVPLYKTEGGISTQYTMTALEELGLLKMDFLGLRTLTVIKDAIEIVKMNKGIDVKFDNDMNDQFVFKLWADGKTDGIFQFESAGMRQFMKELKPDSLEDIIAGVSLYRPGPMDQIPRYIKNKLHPNNIEYTHKSLEPILKVTYGCMVYQEQVMQIFRELADYTLGQADLVRRAMGKKKLDVMAKEREHFIQGAAKHDIDEKSANTIFDEMAEFAKYAFNKSHAAAYAVISYQTAYLKAYYPVEYMAAILTSFSGNQNKVSQYIEDCKKNEIEILKPSINNSYAKFTAIGDKIMFGMASIKNVGEGAVNAIVVEREKNGKYLDFIDFCKRISSEQVNKKCIESLIKAGVFDEFDKNRHTLLSSFENILEGINNDNRKNIEGQVCLFGCDNPNIDTNVSQYSYIEKPEMNIKELLFNEKDMLGIYLSGHPLDSFRSEIIKGSNISSLDISNFDENKEGEAGELLDEQDVVYIGMIVSKKIMNTRNNKMMAFLTVEDLYGTVEVVIFPKIYERFSNILQNDNIIKVYGKLSVREDDSTKILANDLVQIKESRNIKVELNFENITNINKERIINILNFFENNQNFNAEVNIINDGDTKMSKVYISSDIISEIRKILGNDKINVFSE